ncbi:YcnI family protein [Jatrophihabitans sp.]|uniref:YcnI family protein n=1 Tax=Jatrophihabitans sp. TaxID=1932789 RepID=UPI002B8E37ED|nr:YcnI family protein [Jatrophihabitans sp.]
MRRPRRGLSIAVTLAVVWLAGFAGAGAASAHVSVSSPGAVQGGYASIVFKVPTESATASTTGLKVQLPADQPLASVSVLPVPGWSYTVTKAKLATPISSDDGDITEAVSVIEWKAASAATAIKPGEFNQFVISAGPLPKAAAMTFKAIQAYSDGSTVSWIEQAAQGSTAEPEHPAPTLTLAAAGASSAPPSSAAPTASAATTASSADEGNGRATTALVLAIVALLLGAAALTLAGLGRRSGRPS